MTDPKIIEKQREIIRMAKGFCDAKLNAEYAMLAEKLICKLGRKRHVPFSAGQCAIWAAAVIHALGTVNFLFDKSTEPYASIDDINDFFGTKKSTTTNKSKEIRDLLNLEYWDREFSTKEMAGKDPFANMVMVDGFMAPVDMLSKDHQEVIQQAKAEGMDISFWTKPR